MRQVNSNADGESDSITMIPGMSIGRRSSQQYELADLSTAANHAAPKSQADEAVDMSEGQKPRSKLKLILTLLGLYLSLFIHALDQTIVATAIPTIASDLHSSAGYAWIGSAFLLAAAASAAIWAKLSDIWGRKPILLAASAGFFLSSIVCALAQNMPMLIAGRALQGTAAGGLSQICNITISDLFSLRERGFYLGIVEVVWMIACGVGPILGGVLSQKVSWRWIFWINLPVCASTFAMIWFFLDVHNPRTKIKDGIQAIDWFGCLSMVAMTVMTLLGLDFGGVTFPWNSAKVICLLTFGALILLFFIFSETRLTRHPLIQLSLFSSMHNIACLMMYSVIGFVFIADNYFLPLYFQSAREADPITSGLLVVPLAVMASIVGIAVGFAVHRFGRFRELLWIGTAILALGNGLFILLKPETSLGQVIGFGIIAGSGAGFLFSPAVIAVQANVPKEHVSSATSTIFFCDLFWTAVTLVVGEVVFQNSMDQRIAGLRDAGVPNAVLHALGGGNAAANVQIISGISNPQQKLLVKSAYASSLRNVWIMYTCVAGLGVIASFFIKQRTLSKEHVEVKTGLKKDD